MIMRGSVSYRDFKRREFNRKRRVAAAYLRSREVRLLLIAALFALVLFIGIFAGAKLIYASSFNNEEDMAGMTKCYRSVMIYFGEDLHSVAEANIGEGYSSEEAYINEICHINHLDLSTKLIPGNYLTVPYYK